MTNVNSIVEPEQSQTVDSDGGLDTVDAPSAEDIALRDAPDPDPNADPDDEAIDLIFGEDDDIDPEDA